MDVSTGATAVVATAPATGADFDPASVAAALPSIDLPLLQSSSHQQHALHQANGSAAATPSGFYPPSYPYATADTGTTPTVPYSSLISSYNPYSAIPPLEFNMIFNPWGFVDIAAEGPLSAAIEHQTGTTAPFLTPTFSPQVNNFGTMSRYGTRASTAANNGLESNGSGSNANRKGGRRPREEYDRSDISHEDKEKRDKRRQRNKEAAARCRKRRLDLMQTLQLQKDELERRNNQMANQYQSLQSTVQQIIQELQGHRCPMHDQLRHHIDACTNVLRQSQEFSNQIITQQHHQHMAQLNQQQQMMASNSGILPHVSNLQAGNKRSHDEISNGMDDGPIARPSTLCMKDDMNSPDSNFDDSLSTSYDMPPYKEAKFDDSPVDVQRPTSLNINNWDQTPVISTPSACLPFIKSMIPEFNNMLNQQTFLTPTAPSAVTVTSSGGPPQSDDLQTL
uniref:BZIP domain-containing protein n=1 Tax=Panagrellus redivivus TaxID=6233 RepID=A0A7E4W8R2_PANRE